VSVPDWYEVTLLGLAGFRVWRLIAHDTIFDPIRERILRLEGWTEGEPVPDGFRDRLAEFLVCAWCLGFWIAVIAWALWQISPTWTLVFAAPLAISSVIALIAEAAGE
jgi:hypothetical protein